MTFSVRTLLGYISLRKKHIIAAMLAALAMNALSILLLYLFTVLSGTHLENRDLGAIYSMIIWFSVIVALYVIADFCYISNLNRASLESIYNIRSDTFNSTLHIKYKYYTKKYFGELNTNIIHDVEMLGSLVFKRLPNALSDFVYCLAVFAVLLITSYRLALYIIAFIAVFTVYTIFLKSRVERLTEQYAKSRTELNTELDDYIGKIKSIQMYGLVEQYTARIDDSNRHMNKNWFKLNIMAPIIQSSIEFATLLSYVIIFTLGRNYIALGIISPESLFLFLTYLPQIWSRYSTVIDLYTGFVQGGIYAKRAFANLEVETEVDNMALPDNDTSNNSVASVEIRDMCFSYEQSLEVIKHLSWEISKPGLYCVTGPSGRGKSTLFDLLLGLYPVTSGKILICGKNVNDWDLRELRETVGIVHQDSHIISGSILDNIAFGDTGINKSEVEQLLKQYNLTDVLPMPIDQFIPRDSALLTIGMKQVISVARALLRYPQIILFDEVTANMDSYTETLLLNLIKQKSQECICIMISHKPEDSAGACSIIELAP